LGFDGYFLGHRVYITSWVDTCHWEDLNGVDVLLHMLHVLAREEL